MNSFRDSLPGEVGERMRRELGWEESLRLLWPVLVGWRLGCNTRLLSARQATLRVAVPDQVWSKTLSSLQRMILDSVNRFWGEQTWAAIEFVEDPLLWSPPRRPSRPENSVPLPPLTVADLPAAGVLGEELRQVFLESAQKYFAWQEEHRR